MTSFRTTERADDDIIEIYLFGAEHFGIRAAEKYLAGLRRVLELLSIHPGLARLRVEFSPPVHIHPYGSHIVAYREEPGGILVLRVLAAAADWSAHIGDT